MPISSIDTSTPLYSVAFSPIDRTLLAASRFNRTDLIDIRQPTKYVSIRPTIIWPSFNSCYSLVALLYLSIQCVIICVFIVIRTLHSYPVGGDSAQFNSKGTRILLSNGTLVDRSSDASSFDSYSPVVLYDVATGGKPSADRMTTIQFVIPGKQRQSYADDSPVYESVTPRRFSIHYFSPCCFAGKDDELVVAINKYTHEIVVWSVPDVKGEWTADPPLFVLPGHEHKDFESIDKIRYSPANCILASCASSDEKIKFWTPFSLPSSNETS